MRITEEVTRSRWDEPVWWNESVWWSEPVRWSELIYRDRSIHHHGRVIEESVCGHGLAILEVERTSSPPSNGLTGALDGGK